MRTRTPAIPLLAFAVCLLFIAGSLSAVPPSPAPALAAKGSNTDLPLLDLTLHVIKDPGGKITHVEVHMAVSPGLIIGKIFLCYS